MKQILLTCKGTTDPVRGEHDGPILHILRHYRPEEVWIFLSGEMRRDAKEDGSLEKARAWICSHWNGYQPDFRYIESDVANVHDIDALDKPLHDVMEQISRENPDAGILINVTSGTPQMQMILSQFAMDTRYRAKGIQVRNFERSSGTSQRTNDNEYDVELELECNEDELPDVENRCFEPEMYAIRREYQRHQITALLDDRDFSAVANMKDSLPETLCNLVLHLAARNHLQESKAKRLATRVESQLPFKLYAYKTGDRTEYSTVSEYYLLMKNLAAAGNWTEFLLHMSPLTLKLQIAVLDKLTGNRVDSFVYQEGNHLVFDPSGLSAALPDLYQHYAGLMESRDWVIRKNDISTFLCDDLLCFYSNVPEKAQQLFADYDRLKDLRNRLAHSLYFVTADEIRTVCGKEPKELLREIEATIIACYPACDPVIFSVYDRCIAFIKNSL